MSIPARRFNILDRETNVAIADFHSVTSSDIYNSPELDYSEVSEDLQSVIDTDTQVSEFDFKAAKDEFVRKAKDSFGAVKDLKNFSGKDVDKLIAKLLPNNPTAQSLFAKMGPKCQSKGLATGGLGKPYDADINCGGKLRKNVKNGCSAAEYGNVLNKLTNGAYQANHNDLNAALMNLVAMSKFGYDMNMCGVFSALTGDLDPNVLSRASGALLGYLGGTGNVMGFLDLSSSSAGLHGLIENPGGLNGIMTNFAIPDEIREAELTDLCTRVQGGMELFDDGWNSSSYDGMLSADLSSSHNSDVDKMFRAAAVSTPVSADALDAIPDSDFNYMATAYSCGSESFDESFA